MATKKNPLKGLHIVGKYAYAWRGGPALKAERDTPEFLKEFADAHVARKNGKGRTLAGLIVEFKQTPRWLGTHPRKNYADATKRDWGPYLDRIRDEFGELYLAQFDRPEIRPLIRKWHERNSATPTAADRMVEVLSALLTFGMAEGKLSQNACSSIERNGTTSRAEIIWTDADLAALKAKASKEVMDAAMLSALTGLGKAECLALQLSHIKAHSIEIPRKKTRGKTEHVIPIYDALRAHLDAIPRRSVFLLTNQGGQPWTVDGFNSSWLKARLAASEALTEAGVDGAALTKLRFHDLRGTAATRYALAGFGPTEIAQFCGWTEAQVSKIIDRYVHRPTILKARIAKMNASQGA